ncbi:N-acetylmuramoyl-L-alanine amidase [Paenibacillus radicis (ex Gao et al. 2016)]|uniref:N-acetylmuramoyl-L-alanine amidase n=2 Tax=Paenibacillus radicis (ex Gao et al. 2016) TaxID=1737354 RepID=A0A917HP30_9BACL|nr:N-acetylmuramoyl-L-alanine amidase [Paenibacillus radicis (ex Gao et al. 2016)]GGG85759.1 N-acetylmuramoyl-L-alanine amidase [Paenibacillus radicis (ex Gao et al. 2016)]
MLKMLQLAAALLMLLPISLAGASPDPDAADEPQSENDSGWTMPSANILIDAGHGGIDGGASADSVLEKDINLAIAQKLYLLLNSQGISAVLNRTGDYALSDDNRWHITRSRHRRDLSQRRQLTEEIDTQLLVSLHVNATKNRSKSGPIVLHQESGESALLAFCIQDALNRQQETTFYPREGKPFYLLRRVDQPAVIVEMGFISNDADRAMLTDPRQQLEIANAIASGIRQYKWITR